ncbi:Hypp6369 [Branchiostoma lanceolatum]|uniref:Hypp6369 protein n=1 Tax=Branchiostoma lanceolatum TaxID=7740 RepID=A0A8K0E8Z7_BRALA|nr:Hypp6369 [Branchiostoma lanceolatum]
MHLHSLRLQQLSVLLMLALHQGIAERTVRSLVFKASLEEHASYSDGVDLPNVNSIKLGDYGLDKGTLLKNRALGKEQVERQGNGKTSRIRRDIFPLVNDLHSMFMFPWEEQKASGNKTAKANSMGNDIPMADMPTSWIGIDEFLHVITCQMDVACNLGMPNTACSCDDVVNEFGEKKCILPKARITHRSKTTKGIMALFCVGVSLPPMDDGSNYDLQTKCNILGADDVKYRVYVTKEDIIPEIPDEEALIKYKACLEPV